MSTFIVYAESGASDDRATYWLGASSSWRKARAAAEHFARACKSLDVSAPPRRARDGYHWDRPGLDDVMAAHEPLWAEYGQRYAPDDVYVREVPMLGADHNGEFEEFHICDAKPLPGLVEALNALYVEKQSSQSQMSAARLSELVGRYSSALIREQSLIDRKLLGLD